MSGNAEPGGVATATAAAPLPATARWTLLVQPAGRPGWWNMALDQALLEQAGARGAGFVRLYRWAPSCLSFGRHEPASRRYDRAAIAARGLDVVRRPTGGRAVWHARELTYAVAAPAAWLGPLRESHQTIHAALHRALRTLGLESTMAAAAPPEQPGAGACFQTAAGGELLAGGRKVLGSAQCRQGAALLQHGSLLLEDDQQLLADLTLGDQPRHGGETTLAGALGRPVGFEEAAAAVAAAFQAWPGRWEAGGALDPEALAARHAARFRDPAWTWRR